MNITPNFFRDVIFGVLLVLFLCYLPNIIPQNINELGFRAESITKNDTVIYSKDFADGMVGLYVSADDVDDPYIKKFKPNTNKK